MARRFVGWRVEHTGPFRSDVEQLIKRTKNPVPAFNEMADVIAAEQKQWFASNGGGTWAPRKEPYRSQMRKKFPKRKTMHGPDRKGHRGLQLRDDLTRRANGLPRFGVEKITREGMTIGTDLPYAAVHQYGTGRMPKRVVLKPLTPAAEAKLTRILQAHIVGETIRGNTG